MAGMINWSRIKFWQKPSKNESQTRTKKKSIRHRIKRTREYLADMESDELGQAIDAATDIENPDFESLYSLYRQAETDRHLKSQVETAINDIQQSPFIIEVDGKENDDLKDLFDAAWFDDYVEFDAESEFWGHSLVEFPELNDKQVFNACYLIPREHVNPAKHHIILSRDDEEFLPYYDTENDTDHTAELNLIEIKGKERLGLFEFTTQEVILKKYARTDWSQASERYGMPLLKYATDVEDKKELDKIEEMCAEFGSNGYIICGTDDDVEIVQPQKGDFYKIYMEAIELANKELSKIVNGQSATSDTQAYVGSAEVQERIKNTFTKARLRRVQNHINNKLIPLMVQNGYAESSLLEKARFRYTDLMEMEPQLNTEPGEDPADPNEEDEKKGGASAVRNVKKKLWRHALVVAQNLFNGTAFSKVFTRYIEQINQGTNIDLQKTSYTDPRFQLYNNLYADAARFAAFREAQKQRDLDGATTDLDRAKIEKRYAGYLKTEEHAVFMNSASAERWVGFQENADLYPNLEWVTAGDSDVRQEHQRLDGLTLPINDPFWRKNTPPLGWGCRCDLVQTDKPAKKTEGYQDTTAPKGFDFNPGMDQKLFADSAGYYTSASDTDSTKLLKQAQTLASVSLKTDILKEWPQAGKIVKFKGVEGYDSITISKGDIRDITFKFHDNKVLRNALLYDIDNVLKEAKTVLNKPEGKNRPKYKSWYYLQVKGFDNMFLNIAEMGNNGGLKLHAITNEVQKK